MRIAASVLFFLCVSLLSIAAMLRPDPRGFGTHEQMMSWRLLPGQKWAILGSPCGFQLLTHLPCPTCGMTTAFAHTVRADVRQAFMAQPAGLLFALLAIVMTPVTLLSAWHGRWVLPTWWLRHPGRVLAAFMIAFLGGWSFKLVIAAFAIV